MSTWALKMRARRERASGFSAQMLEISRARISPSVIPFSAVASATLCLRTENLGMTMQISELGTNQSDAPHLSTLRGLKPRSS